MRPVFEDDRIRVSCVQAGSFGTNAYVVRDVESGQSLLIDAPGDADFLIAEAENPRYILLTHSHMDHIAALAEVKAALKVPFAAHAADASNLPLKPDIYLDGGEVLELGATPLRVIHTPGHTPGGLSFLVGECLFSGDTLFPGGPGYTGSAAAFRAVVKSISGELLTLPGQVLVFPGHGDPTTVVAAAAEYAVFAARTHASDLYGEITWAGS